MRSFLLASIILLTCAASAGAANLYVAPGGASATCASQLNPCGSLNAAYQAAQPGDTVEVAGGSYGSQNLVFQASKSSSADVTFRPAAGAFVTVAALNFGSTYDQQGASHVTVQGIDVRGEANFRRTVDVHLQNVRIHGAPFGAGNIDLSFQGGEWGDPNVTKSGWHPEFTWYPSGRSGNGGKMIRPDGLTVDGVYLHDIQRPDKATHTNCLHPQDGTNIYIINNVFQRCDAIDMLISPSGGSGTMSNIYVTRNTFYPSTDTVGTGQGTYSAQVDSLSATVTGLHVWKNTFVQPHWLNIQRAGTTGDKYGNTGVTKADGSVKNGISDQASPLVALASDPEGPGPEPTPTPTPTATPSPSPTATPSPTPSPTPTATPSPTPTATPEPTPTPEPVYAPDCRPTCDQQLDAYRAWVAQAPSQ